MSYNENEEFNRMPIPERCEAELGEVFDQAKLALGCNEYNRLVDNAKKNSLDMDYRFPSHSGEMSTNYLFALGHIKKLEANGKSDADEELGLDKLDDEYQDGKDNGKAPNEEEVTPSIEDAIKEDYEDNGEFLSDDDNTDGEYDTDMDDDLIDSAAGECGGSCHPVNKFAECGDENKAEGTNDTFASVK